MLLTAIRISIFCMIASLVACTTRLATSPEGSGQYTVTAVTAGNRLVSVGPEYGLPMLQFDLQVQRTLLQCEDDKKEPKIRFLLKVESQPSYVIGERFNLNYDGLSSWSKISSFKHQTYDSGTLKSINAEAADQTKAIIGNSIKSGISLLSLAQGVPMANLAQQPPGQGPQIPAGHVCTANTKEILKTVASIAGTLKIETNRLIALTAEIARLERLASLAALTEADKTALSTAQKNTTAQSKRVSTLEMDLAAATGALSVSEQIVWPQTPTQTTLNVSPNPMNRAKLESLFENGPGGYQKEDFEATLQLRSQIAGFG